MYLLQLDFPIPESDTESVVQLSFNNYPPSLRELREGECGVLDRLDLPADAARRLMELGFLPGSCVTAAHSAPSGDPRVYRVDGSEVALRLDTARHLFLRQRSEFD